METIVTIRMQLQRLFTADALHKYELHARRRATTRARMRRGAALDGVKSGRHASRRVICAGHIAVRCIHSSQIVTRVSGPVARLGRVLRRIARVYERPATGADAAWVVDVQQKAQIPLCRLPRDVRATNP